MTRATGVKLMSAVATWLVARLKPCPPETKAVNTVRGVDQSTLITMRAFVAVAARINASAVPLGLNSPVIVPFGASGRPNRYCFALSMSRVASSLFGAGLGIVMFCAEDSVWNAVTLLHLPDVHVL